MCRTFAEHTDSFMYSVFNGFSLEMYMKFFHRSFVKKGNRFTCSLFVFLREKLPYSEDVITLSFFKECCKTTTDFILHCSNFINLKCIPKHLLTEQLNFQVKEALRTNALLKLNKAFIVICSFDIKVYLCPLFIKEKIQLLTNLALNY
jgi:hypothetical protein